MTPLAPCDPEKHAAYACQSESIQNVHELCTPRLAAMRPTSEMRVVKLRRSLFQSSAARRQVAAHRVHAQECCGPRGPAPRGRGTLRARCTTIVPAMLAASEGVAKHRFARWKAAESALNVRCRTQNDGAHKELPRCHGRSRPEPASRTCTGCLAEMLSSAHPTRICPQRVLQEIYWLLRWHVSCLGLPNARSLLGRKYISRRHVSSEGIATTTMASSSAGC